MATLKEFLDKGRLGSITLGMSPNDVMNLLGDPEEVSRKKNPLLLKYGGLQLVFWKSPKQHIQQLCEIIISYKPTVEPLPDSLQLTDFLYDRSSTEYNFRSYMHSVGSLPVHLVDGSSGRQLLFISGVSVLFVEGELHSIRLVQKVSKEPERIPTEGEREPTQGQIAEMLQEAAQVMQIGALRSALMIAWAGLEAALRQEAVRSGMQGKIGIQPSILIRELLAAKKISSFERDMLENLRQLRIATVHGLAPIGITKENVLLIIRIAKRLLLEKKPSLRKVKEIEYIMAVNAVEAFSVLVRTQHSQSLSEFLKSHNLRVHVEERAIGGDDPHDDIQVQKRIEFPEFNRLIEEWKWQYINE